MAGQLALIDYIVLALYLGVTVAVGLWLGRRMTTGKDFFLAGRQLPWWAIGLSLVATDIGGTDIIGVGGAAYSYGMAVANFEWIGCIPAMVVAAFVFIPLFWRAGVYTIPEFLERRFNPAVRTALALCWLAFMACNLGIMLFASARMMHVLFGWHPVSCILLTAGLVGVYTVAGGLAAVVYTDTIQCVVLMSGCGLVLGLGLWEAGGIGPLFEQVRALESAAGAGGASEARMVEHTRLILPVDTESPFPWPGILFGLGMILGPACSVRWAREASLRQRPLTSGAHCSRTFFH
jgi:solute:Na+ symporter, SSS family